MKKLLLTLMLFTIATFGFAQTPTDGDYRSISSGNWSDATKWQIRTAGVWNTASVEPTATNNVYIQHAVIVDVANAFCKDLQINNAAGVGVSIGINTLNVNGKVRNFTGSVETSGADGVLYTNLNSTALTATTITTATTNVIKLVI